ncbi:MAG TPA: hypothetical protein VF273_09220 [Pelobium sp.]
MNRIFEIAIHPVGDPTPKLVQVFYVKRNDEYELGLSKVESENPRITFKDGKIVQTAGTPLDSNTLRHVSEQIKKEITL